MTDETIYENSDIMLIKLTYQSSRRLILFTKKVNRISIVSQLSGKKPYFRLQAVEDHELQESLREL